MIAIASSATRSHRSLRAQRGECGRRDEEREAEADRRLHRRSRRRPPRAAAGRARSRDEHSLDRCDTLGGYMENAAAQSLRTPRTTCPTEGTARSRGSRSTRRCTASPAARSARSPGWRSGPRPGFSNGATVVLSIVLAFVFGYGLTSLPLLRAGLPVRRVAGVAFASDTLSITTMEIVDNAIVLAVPGAMDAGLGTLLFWGSLSFALAVAGGADRPGQPLAARPRQGACRGPRDGNPRRPVAARGRRPGGARVRVRRRGAGRRVRDRLTGESRAATPTSSRYRHRR